MLVAMHDDIENTSIEHWFQSKDLGGTKWPFASYYCISRRAC